MGLLRRLQNWYHSQCNGDWEHTYGVNITNIDNPGWAIDVDVTETVYENAAFDSLKIERSDTDWIHAFRENTTIKLRCGPENLEESLRIFLDWTEHVNERTG